MYAQCKRAGRNGRPRTGCSGVGWIPNYGLYSEGWRGLAQVGVHSADVIRHFAKVGVEGSNPFARSKSLDLSNPCLAECRTLSSVLTLRCEHVFVSGM